MKVLHLAAGNRWTGAAAPAFAEVEALRGAGVEAHYAYVGGYKLEAKIGHLDFTHAIIENSQDPFAFFKTLRELRRLIERERFDIVHSHLSHDHWLARFSSGDARIARTFHARRVLRGDLLSRSLLNATQGLFVINADFASAPVFEGRPVVFTPPPLDHRQFSPEGPNVRERYGVEAGAPLLVVIGKLAPGRGFEEAIKTFACVRKTVAGAKLMVIGHGEHRPLLETLTRGIGVASDVIWAGYHEDDLAEHYRAANVLLFTAKGSDEGHRAVLEAMACGVPPATYPIEGMAALAGALSGTLIATEGTPVSLAERVSGMLRDPSLRRQVVTRSAEFGFVRAAERLLGAYDGLAGR